MKITAVEAICLAIPMKPLDPPSSWTGSTRKQIVVRITTDAGITGIGEAFAYGAPLAVCNAIEENLAPLIVGQDPLRIEHLGDLMQRATMIWGRRGLGMFAISGIDSPSGIFSARRATPPSTISWAEPGARACPSTRASCATTRRRTWPRHARASSSRVSAC